MTKGVGFGGAQFSFVFQSTVSSLATTTCKVKVDGLQSGGFAEGLKSMCLKAKVLKACAWENTCSPSTRGLCFHPCLFDFQQNYAKTTERVPRYLVDGRDMDPGRAALCMCTDLDKGADFNLGRVFFHTFTYKNIFRGTDVYEPRQFGVAWLKLTGPLGLGLGFRSM